MKIFMILYASIAPGRANSDLYSLIKELLSRGHKVVVMARSDEYQKGTIKIGDLILVSIYPHKIITWILLYPYMLLRTLIRALKERPDVIISSKSMVLPIAFIVSRVLKRPLVILFRETLAENLVYKYTNVLVRTLGILLYHIELHFLRALRAPILAIDEGLYALASNLYKAKVLLMRYPVSISVTNKLSVTTSNRNVVIVYSGRISKDRNIEMLIDAFCCIIEELDHDKMNRVKLVITGYGEWNYLLRYLRTKPQACQAKIHVYRGWLRRKEVLDILFNSDVGVETFQRRFPECIQLGTKVVDYLLTGNIILVPKDPYYEYLYNIVNNMIRTIMGERSINVVLTYNSKHIEDLKEKIKLAVSLCHKVDKEVRLSISNVLKQLFDPHKALIKVYKGIKMAIISVKYD
ncbi:MAG: hypothetical protein DRN15_09740 [Thermoprotei archaeon]|nr:MAG: hypothetical protein DRN15_09740 [Thermoprotei archaeon]